MMIISKDKYFILLDKFNKFCDKVDRALEGKGLLILRDLVGDQERIYVLLDLRYTLIECIFFDSGRFILKFGELNYSKKYSNGIDLRYMTKIIGVTGLKSVSKKSIIKHVDSQLKKYKEIRERVKMTKIEEDFR